MLGHFQTLASTKRSLTDGSASRLSPSLLPLARRLPLRSRLPHAWHFRYVCASDDVGPADSLCRKQSSFDEITDLTALDAEEEPRFLNTHKVRLSHGRIVVAAVISATGTVPPCNRCLPRQ